MTPADHNQLTKLLRERARELCPDYPGIETCEEPFTHLWALTSSLEGTVLACGDLHQRIAELERQLSVDASQCHAVASVAAAEARMKEGG